MKLKLRSVHLCFQNNSLKWKLFHLVWNTKYTWVILLETKGNSLNKSDSNESYFPKNHRFNRWAQSQKTFSNVLKDVAAETSWLRNAFFCQLQGFCSVFCFVSCDHCPSRFVFTQRSKLWSSDSETTLHNIFNKWLQAKLPWQILIPEKIAKMISSGFISGWSIKHQDAFCTDKSTTVVLQCREGEVLTNIDQVKVGFMVQPASPCDFGAAFAWSVDPQNGICQLTTNLRLGSVLCQLLFRDTSLQFYQYQSKIEIFLAKVKSSGPKYVCCFQQSGK